MLLLLRLLLRELESSLGVDVGHVLLEGIELGTRAELLRHHAHVHVLLVGSL